MRAFWVLSSERPHGDKTIGPIPWSKAREYGRSELGLEPEMLDVFWRIISALDATFRDWMKSEHDRYVRLNKPRKKTGNKTTTRKTYNRA